MKLQGIQSLRLSLIKNIPYTTAYKFDFIDFPIKLHVVEFNKRLSIPDYYYCGQTSLNNELLFNLLEHQINLIKELLLANPQKNWRSTL